MNAPAETRPEFPTLADVEAAAARIAGRVHRTPVLTARRIDASVTPGVRLQLKCENLQRTGAFKLRGATNAVRSLSEPAARARDRSAVWAGGEDSQGRQPRGWE